MQAAAEQPWLSEQPSMPRPCWSRLSEGTWLWMVTVLLTQGRRGDDLGVLHSLPAPTREPGASGALQKGICPPAAVQPGRGRETGLLSEVPWTTAWSDSPWEHCQLLFKPALASQHRCLVFLHYQQKLLTWCLLSTKHCENKHYRRHFTHGKRAPPAQKVPAHFAVGSRL